MKALADAVPAANGVFRWVWTGVLKQCPFRSVRLMPRNSPRMGAWFWLVTLPGFGQPQKLQVFLKPEVFAFEDFHIDS